MQKDPGQMEAFYLKAVQANPRDYEAQTALAKFYSQSPCTKYDEAAKHAQVALQLDPTRVEAYWILARVFALQQQWGGLEQTLANAEKNVPDDLRSFTKLRKHFWKPARTIRELKSMRGDIFLKIPKARSQMSRTPTDC